MDTVVRLYTRFRDAELEWIQQYDQQQQRQQQQHEQQVQPHLTSNNPAAVATYDLSAERLESCSLHSGEFAFVLSGVKPAMLVQMPTVPLTQDFFRKVLENNLKEAQSPGENNVVQYRLITKQISSPEMPLQGCVLIWSPEAIVRHDQTSLLQDLVDRLCSAPSPPSSLKSSVSSTASFHISEEELALLLDYPGRLPTTHVEMQQMIEVSYWHQPPPPSAPTATSSITSASQQLSNTTEEQEPRLLTAFAAQPNQIPRIQSHFQTYRDAVRNEPFNLHLKLHIQSLAE
ncbi:hypothetical protein BGZ83_003859 [Gryganskiella cystojenkinii]|nr:hypothetical protein BGZ83_003859 [Gryganskiella cystojenkinii]